MSEPTELYRHFDRQGRLLYIGISKDAEKRAAQHRSNSEWFVYQFSMTVETLPTRALALKAEKDAINKEKPPYNKDGPACDDYDYWIDKLPSRMAMKAMEIEDSMFDHMSLIKRKEDSANTEMEYWIDYAESFYEERREPLISGITTMRGMMRANVKSEIVSKLGGTLYEEDSDSFILNDRVMIIKLQDPIY